MKTKTERALRVVGNAGEVLADAPEGSRRSTFSETAVLKIVEENQALREQIATLQGAQSVWALSQDGMVMREASEILKVVRGISEQMNALANFLQGQQPISRREFDVLKSDVSGISARVPV